MEGEKFGVVFFIPGQPVAKGRPRFARRGKGMVAYTDDKTLGYENLVRLLAARAMDGRAPSAAPISMTVRLAMQIPASWSKARRARAAAGLIRATKKPDIDNVLKGICDGCNGIIWRDDAQVVVASQEKAYGETPGVIVTISELEGEAAP